MANCMVILLHLWQRQVAVHCQQLPPQRLPQQLLPEDARFVGVGLIGDADVYLYAVSKMRRLSLVCSTVVTPESTVATSGWLHSQRKAHSTGERLVGKAS